MQFKKIRPLEAIDNYFLTVEFNDGKKFKRINMTKQVVLQEFKRYARESLILKIKKLDWGKV